MNREPIYDPDRDERTLDAMLNRADQRQMGELVRSLPEEEPSLAWRSALNERLRAAAPVRRPRAWIIGRLGGAAAGLACAIFLAWLVAPKVQESTQQRRQPLVEAQSTGDLLVAAYQDMVTTAEFSPAGDVLEPTGEDFSPSWSDLDIGSL